MEILAKTSTKKQREKLGQHQKIQIYGSLPDSKCGSQVAADGGCGTDVVHRMNEGKAFGVLESVLSN